jgi:putative DNA primase/helicase
MNGTDTPKNDTCSDSLLDQAYKLIRAGATCTELILENSELLAEWVSRTSADPVIKSKLAEEADRGRQNSITPTTKNFEKTDLGNSERFVFRYGRDCRYCHPQKAWYIWDQTRWKRDETGQIVDLAKRVVRYIGDEASLIDGDTERAAMWKWAATSQTSSRIEGMISLSRSALPILPEDLDRNHDLLNFPNGTLNLRDFSFRDNRREDFCSKVMGCDYDRKAKCPTWESHLELIFGGDKAFISDFQVMAGYSLLATNPEQIFFILYGCGKNGKSVTVSTLAKIFGEYSANIAAESLMIHKNPDTPRSDIVKLSGARLITASESDSSHRLSESLIKALTGDDTITARNLYEKERDFKVTGKIWFSTNHRPIIRGTDMAIWRRVWLIPFEVVIPEERRDRFISEKLQAEGPGIVNWMLEGLRKYRENGDRLRMPEKVALATKRYRADSDVIGQFLADGYVLEPNARIERSVLYEQYNTYCKSTGENILSARTFNEKIQERGVTQTVYRGTRYWVGIRAKTRDEIMKETQTTDIDSCMKDAVVQDGAGSKNFPGILYIDRFEKTPGNISEPAPSCTTGFIPSSKVEAISLLVWTGGDLTKLTPEQKEAIRKVWPDQSQADVKGEGQHDRTQS